MLLLLRVLHRDASQYLFIPAMLKNTKKAEINKWLQYRLLHLGGKKILPVKMCVNGNIGNAVQTVYP